MSTNNQSLGTYLGNNLYYDANTNNMYVVDNSGNMHIVITTSTASPTNYSIGTIPNAQPKPKNFESEKISGSLIDILSDELNASA